ncbi:hypothetical protein AB4653_25115, partial [Vibrio sp. 10N.222.48.A3]|uniref:hypothetical protein n=1 Tax=Vibrio sp. 10N.222.48.A3 TaxID=3229604 RepID=UPI003550DF69
VTALLPTQPDKATDTTASATTFEIVFFIFISIFEFGRQKMAVDNSNQPNDKYQCTVRKTTI